MNRTIIDKLKTKTENDLNMRNFLWSLCDYEEVGHGWYEKKYNGFIDTHCPDEEEGGL